MLNFNHGALQTPNAAADLTERLNRLIDDGLERRNADAAPRDYLGASILGGSCSRQIQYEYAGAPRDEGKEHAGSTLRVFAAGHAFEAMSAAELQAAGFDLKISGKDGRQFGFSVAGGRFRGHVDGVFLGGPPVIAYPALWEHKALGPKSWNEVVKKGLAAARPVYAVQIALYQAYLDLPNPAVFTARNRDTQALYHEPVPFDAVLAQRMSDRAVTIIQATDAGELLPRHTENRDHFECRFCAFAGRCWA